MKGLGIFHGNSFIGMAAAGIHVFDLRTFDAAIFCQFIDSKDRTVILRGNLQRISKMIGMSVGEQNRVDRKLIG
ncbi:hypothetical protein D3C87_1905930 [compost metagenome]